MRKWNIANDQSNANYSVGNNIIYSTKVLKFNLCDYNYAYILVRGNITVVVATQTQMAFKNSAPFTKCITKIDGTTTVQICLTQQVVEATNEATNFYYDIVNTDDSKAFKYIAKL